MIKYYLFLLMYCLGTEVIGQSAESNALFRTIKENDSLLFDIGFNTCDISQFEKLISNNFEFYHDQAGITGSKEAFIEGIKSGLCKLNYKPLRILVTNSMQVFAMKNKEIVYGAIQTGVHSFYAREENVPEYLTSTAKFTHLWLLEEGKWKLVRVLSYDHQEFKKP